MGEYSRLTPIKRVGTKNKCAIGLFQCDCGNTHEAAMSLVVRGNTTSCGCYRKEVITKHGKSGTLLYSIWMSMKDRCYNKRSSSYPNYGGRGIRVCGDWLEFSEFHTWCSQNGYQDGMTLERIDNNKGYSPDNCKIISKHEQSYNKLLFSTNTSGVTGVQYDKYGDRWKAVWHEYPSGVCRRKSFSIKKYGEEAFRLACEYRKKMIEEQIANGAPYSENYGGVKKYDN